MFVILAIVSAVLTSKADSSDYDVLNIILLFFGLSISILYALFVVAMIIAAAINMLLGLLGIACCKQQGKCSLGCLIMGGLLSLIAAANIVIGIDVCSFLILAHFGLYTAGAAIAYIDSKNDKKEI
ncbi:MAG: hypothetical protein K2G04_01405 [Oscillospiraceae bacterium]|nr:hypothetical protein [Oscillospiraceae bacterium]